MCAQPSNVTAGGADLLARDVLGPSRGGMLRTLGGYEAAAKMKPEIGCLSA